MYLNRNDTFSHAYLEFGAVSVFLVGGRKPENPGGKKKPMRILAERTYRQRPELSIEDISV